MIRAQHLIRGSHLRISRLDHDKDVDHHDPEEEICSSYAVNLVEAGSFGIAVNDTHQRLSSGHVFLSQPGAVHRYSHYERVPTDICVSVTYSGALAEQISQSDESVAERLPLVIRPTNRLAFLRLQLNRLLEDDCALHLEQWACELISAICATTRPPDHLYRARQLRWYAERVQAVREIFETRYAESHSLVSVASSVGMSAFQFARVFSELVGVPPHQYLLRVRLERASQMLRDGNSVTRTCFDVGFSNLSHFTRSFQRRFGVVPSSLKSRQRTI